MFFRKKKKPPTQKPPILSPDQLFTEYPDGIRDYLLRAMSLKLMDTSLRAARSHAKAADIIADRQVNRNMQGIDLEKSDPQAAIQLYEQNISEMFIGEHPYKRLRILYTKQKNYDNAIRVCERYIAMADQVATLNIRNPSSQKQAEYQEWIAKLTTKRDSQ